MIFTAGNDSTAECSYKRKRLEAEKDLPLKKSMDGAIKFQNNLDVNYDYKQIASKKGNLILYFRY